MTEIKNPKKSSYVYLLECSDGSTYVGATVDLDHRLRQHNKEIKGGATATSVRVLRGETWRRVCYVQNFPDWISALQFEWRFKQLSRKLFSNQKPLLRRMLALKQLLSLERPTTKAVLYNDWEFRPDIIWEQESDRIMYEHLGV